MIRHKCEACGHLFNLDSELEPFVCECDRTLCPLCEEDGCCRRLDQDDPPCPNASCVSGMVELAGDCMSCGGLGCYVENGITRECRVCGGDAWLDVSLCETCGGYGYLVARRVKRRRA